MWRRCLFIVCVATALAAQQTPPNAPSTAQPQSEQDIQKKEQSRRILGVVPTFGVTNRQNAPPLTPRQKFHLFARTSVDPFQFVTAGITAGIGQANNDFPSYGQGAAGFGKRYGAALADGVSSNFFGTFTYPVLFKQDPRYFRLGEGSFKRRFGYSLSRSVVCRTDRGGRSFNWSNILGVMTSGAISNAYYPSEDRGFGLTMGRAGIALIYGGASDLLDEFWPDIQRKVFHKKD